MKANMDPAPQGRTMGVAKGTESARPADQEAGLADSIDAIGAASNSNIRFIRAQGWLGRPGCFLMSGSIKVEQGPASQVT